MAKYIEFGGYNKKYNFIFIAIGLNILLFYFPKFIISLLLKYNKISKKVEELSNHLYIIEIFLSFCILAFSCILNGYEIKLSKIGTNFDKLNSSNLDKGCFKSIKNNEIKKKKLNNGKNLLNILIIVIICTFSEIILTRLYFLR